MAKAGNIDWVSVERHFRETSMAVREIGRIHGVAESTIRRRAKDGEWVRGAQDAAQEGAEKAACMKVEGLTLDDIKILANTYGVPQALEDQFELAGAARLLAPVALVTLVHLAVAGKSEAVRRQASHELLTWGFGKPVGIADGDGAPRSSRQHKTKALGKKEALVEAANNPDTGTAMGKMMAQRAAATRRSH